MQISSDICACSLSGAIGRCLQDASICVARIRAKLLDTTLGGQTRFRSVGCFVDRGKYSLSTRSVLRRSHFQGSTLYPVALGHMCNRLYSWRLHTVTACNRENIPSDRSRLWKSPCDT